MYLKSIKSQGFKSFADKIDLEINPGITGIVGPNGSGKSNIVDAVRWVLGEQSAKSLRSGAMTEVIFNGSSSREAQKRAMVALTFDNTDHYLNCDFYEVEVKRIVYNTGENEYYLNNSRVRLKDISDLFIESGTGAGAFNIISQGNVTDIVNGKSTDRRLVIESAAHVLKYKKRKEESLHKLEKTEENLLRLDLIIKELQTTIAPLKEESQKAAKYLEIKKDLESIDIALICEDITTLNETYQNTEKEIEILKNQTAGYTNSSEESKLEKLKLSNLSVDDKLSSAREKLLNLTKKLSGLNNEKQLTMERQKYEVDTPKINESLVNLKTAQLNLEKNRAIIEEEIGQLKQKRTAYHEEFENISDNLIKSRLKKEKCQRALDKKNKDILIYQNKIEILENNIKNDTASPLAVRNVLSNPRLTGIHNTLGKLITTNDEYLVALDTALGNSKNFLVVTDESSAIAAINYLKENKLGRATFLPLNVINARFIAEADLAKIKNVKGYMGLLNSFVTCSGEYQNIIDYQLGNVILTKDALTMSTISKLLNHKYRVVSLDGEIQNVGGSITGGITKTNNIIYEKNELNKLKQELNKLNVELADLNQNLTNVNEEIYAWEKQENNLIKEDLSLKENLTVKENTFKEYSNLLETKKSELAGLEDLQNNTLDNKLLTLLEEINIVTKDQELVEQEITNLSQEKSDLNEKINILEKEIKEHNLLYNNKLNDLKNKEVLLGKTEVKLDNLLNTLNTEYNLTYDYAQVNYSLDLKPDLARERVNLLKRELNKLGAVNIGSIAEYERLNQRYEFLTKQKDDLEKASRELKAIIEEMDDIMIHKFRDTFGQVAKEFSRIFTLMFKGGQGKLVLTNPDDLLNTGMDIIAIPPGKKIASPMSLSGGEKALTAICLLFAILEVRPAPFIILDEAEAALDEANVDMFGKYLNEEKSKSQFIVITHKKRMMEYADTLYGMTMQESGVSKIVSTKLAN